ncbi:distribution regulator misato [Anaeramoeba flamelloides]|uniref:Distribution regulator misato n=1 Tax=Anaeramoeba flamelloides TaxID=1746091 RepID=A0ABQ8X237_9EUKA|nr:distribution regulator misato [Anaeramoeba flamelloides]
MELIYLQFGHYANFVGTHLWNIQCTENMNGPLSQNRSFIVREKTTYPRLLLFDERGSLGSLTKEGTLSSFVKNKKISDPYLDKEIKKETRQSFTWQGNYEQIITDEPYKKNFFLKSYLEKSEQEKEEELEEQLRQMYLKNERQEFQKPKNPRKKKQESKRFREIKLQQEKGIEIEFEKGEEEKEEEEEEEREKTPWEILEENFNTLNRLTNELNNEDENENEYENENKNKKTNINEGKYEKIIKVWSDYLTTNLHSKTIVELSSFQKDTNPLDTFYQGFDSWKEDIEQRDQVEDQFRFWLEESDLVQGLVATVDHFTGFGGYSSKVFEMIHDEVPKIRSVVFAPSHRSFTSLSPSTDAKEILNSALTLSHLNEYSYLYIPLELDYDYLGYQSSLLNWQLSKRSEFCSSGILSSVIDGITMPWRMKRNPIALAQLVDTISIRTSMKFAAANCSVPFPVEGDLSVGLPQALERLGSVYRQKKKRNTNNNNPDYDADPLCTSLSPFANHHDLGKLYSEYAMFNGLDEHIKLKNQGTIQTKELTKQFLEKKNCYRRMNQLYSHPLKIPSIFPKVFNHSVDQNGKIFKEQQPSIYDKYLEMVMNGEIDRKSSFQNEQERIQKILDNEKSNRPQSINESEDLHVKKAPIFSNVYSSENLQPIIRNISEKFKSVDFRLCKEFYENGLDSYERGEVLNNIYTLSEQYED